MLSRIVVNSHIHHHLSYTNRVVDTETFKILNTTTVTPLSLVLFGDNFEVYVHNHYYVILVKTPFSKML